MHHADMPRRPRQPQTAPAQPLTGLLLVAPLKRKNGSRELGKLLDREAAERIAKRADQLKNQQEAK